MINIENILKKLIGQEIRVINCYCIVYNNDDIDEYKPKISISLNYSNIEIIITIGDNVDDLIVVDNLNFQIRKTNLEALLNCTIISDSIANIEFVNLLNSSSFITNYSIDIDDEEKCTGIDLFFGKFELKLFTGVDELFYKINLNTLS